MISRGLILVAKGWQKGPSKILPPSCRFTPSCSAYAITAWSQILMWPTVQAPYCKYRPSFFKNLLTS